MKAKFDIVFLDPAVGFIENLDAKTRIKVFYNIDKARFINDPKLFKKLEGEIWEFRTKYQSIQYRLFAFWDRSEKTKTLVISTHGMIKKANKTPKNEIRKAEKLRREYFKHKI